MTIGKITIGGGESIAIQSMLSKRNDDFDGNICQAVELQKEGCDIIRVAIPDFNTVKLIEKLKENVSMPVVADVHFDYRLAIESVAAGADKIRINPGNIGDPDRVKAVAKACEKKGIPIRVGVNSGSLEKNILAKYGGVTAEGLVESARQTVNALERFDFDNIVLAIKSSDVKNMIKASRMISEIIPYPLHLGVTEAGTGSMGEIKSAIGIGGLLVDGIGDTIRVSLSDEPVFEVRAAKNILKAVGLYEGVEIISCPTCGRTRIDVIKLAKEIEDKTKDMRTSKKIKVAIMGCAVNGPGEAREADIGIAGGESEGLLFKKGEIIRKIPQNTIADELLKEIKTITNVTEK